MTKKTVTLFFLLILISSLFTGCNQRKEDNENRLPVVTRREELQKATENIP